MKLEHDEFWDVIEGCKTFESFCKKTIPDFNKNKNIPEAVQRKLGVVQKLMTYSYYEYDFLDVAMLQTFYILELALSLKYKSLPNYKKDLKNLTLYLDWALRKNYILKSQKEQIIYLRNNLFHPKDESIFGMIAINVIKVNVELISNLF